MRISDWSSDVCSSDLVGGEGDRLGVEITAGERLIGLREDQRIVGHAVRLDRQRRRGLAQQVERGAHDLRLAAQAIGVLHARVAVAVTGADRRSRHQRAQRSEEHTSELQSLMRKSYDVFCLKKKKHNIS